MQEKLVELLKERKETITTAESCTGGLISASIVDVASASSVFNMSFVTYSNESKCQLLHVNPKTIEKHGVVSEQVTFEMALGAAKAADANAAISVSGIAGPTGGTDTKPVGMVCFGFYYNGEITTTTKLFGNVGRNKVRALTRDFAIERMIEIIENKN